MYKGVQVMTTKHNAFPKREHRDLLRLNTASFLQLPNDHDQPSSK
ncbi:hypothetical protein TNCV_4279381, partial [Trichonephila clavipes]